MVKLRQEQQDAVDKGKWKDPNQSLSVLTKKADKVYKLADGKTDIFMVVYRRGVKANKIVLKGEKMP